MSAGNATTRKPMNDHSKGLLITGIGGFILTFDIPMIMLADGNLWSVQLVRSGAGFVAAIAVYMIARTFFGLRTPLVPGRTGLLVAGLYGLNALTFTAAVFNTSAANLVFILAFNSMFAALLAWFFIGERPRPVTIATMVVMLGAVLLIVGDGLQAGNTLGDFFALCTAFLLAVAITIARKTRTDMGFAPAVGALLPIVLAGTMLASGKAQFQMEAPWWIIANGAIMLPVAFWCLATGPKYISGPEVAMFYLLETVLAPVWVWLVFGETPGTVALIGGVIIISALTFHSAYLLVHQRRHAPGVIAGAPEAH